MAAPSRPGIVVRKVENGGARFGLVGIISYQATYAASRGYTDRQVALESQIVVESD
jgi:hypothetical protein